MEGGARQGRLGCRIPQKLHHPHDCFRPATNLLDPKHGQTYHTTIIATHGQSNLVAKARVVHVPPADKPSIACRAHDRPGDLVLPVMVPRGPELVSPRQHLHCASARHGATGRDLCSVAFAEALSGVQTEPFVAVREQSSRQGDIHYADPPGHCADRLELYGAQ